MVQDRRPRSDPIVPFPFGDRPPFVNTVDRRYDLAPACSNFLGASAIRGTSSFRVAEPVVETAPPETNLSCARIERDWSLYARHFAEAAHAVNATAWPGLRCMPNRSARLRALHGKSGCGAPLESRRGGNHGASPRCANRAVKPRAARRRGSRLADPRDQAGQLDHTCSRRCGRHGCWSCRCRSVAT